MKLAPNRPATHTLLPYQTGNEGAYALVGMGAAFAGIVRTPMTSVIMIFEVTRDYTIIVSLMIANLCSYFLAQKLQRLPIYEALSHQDGIAMPSSAHRPEPLTVERAMRPVAVLPINAPAMSGPYVPFVYPDDPVDSALQRMGEARLEQLPVIGRAGGRQIGTLTSADILRAYQEPAGPEKRASAAEPARGWLPVVAGITLAAILIVSGLVFLQRWRRAGLGLEAYHTGQALLAQGRVDEAVLAFRRGLVHTSQNADLRAALGLALVQSGHFIEASSYLAEAARSQPANGVVWMGLARVAIAAGDRRRALDLFRQAFSREWTPQQESLRTEAQFDFVALLSENGRRSEAIPLLPSMIEQHSDDPAAGKRAAAIVRSICTPQQIEEGYTMLAERYPADAAVWQGLGDARFLAGKDAPALEAYRRAAQSDPISADAQSAVVRTQEVLNLDPTRRGISVRERVRRWDQLLQRVLAAVAPCGTSTAAEKAKSLLGKRTVSLAASDQKMEATLALWQSAPASCKQDPLLAHILAKVHD